MSIRLQRIAQAVLFGGAIATATPALAGAKSREPSPASILVVPSTASRFDATAAPATYVVFFGFESASLTPYAREVIISAASHARRALPIRIIVTTYADSLHHEAKNTQLSTRRTAAVRAELVRDGLHSAAFNVASNEYEGSRAPRSDIEVREASR